MNKILIIGGTGFIGYHLAKKCLKRNFKVTSLSKRPPKKIRFLKKVKYIICDINDEKKLKKSITGKFNYIVNLGGYDEKATQSEDFLLSRKVKPNKFKLIPNLMTQDNRRFKRYGYWSMVKLLYINWKNRNTIEHFYKDQGYWK